MAGIEHLTVHEAEFALFHSWRDGMPVNGPFDRHLESDLIAKFTAGLRITRNPDGEDGRSFGNWRANEAGGCQSLWTVETSAALAMLFEDVQISSFLAPGSPLIVLVRFYASESGRWRLLQFHDAEIGPLDASEASENMMHSVVFRAGWMEEFLGATASTLPPLVPRIRGVIEWRHLGRRIPCWYFDPVAGVFEESPENVMEVEGEDRRYVTLDESGDPIRVAYLAATTLPGDGLAGLPSIKIGWIDAWAIQIPLTGSSGLTPEPGWSVQEGAAEPITIPASGRHWEHPRVVIRFLGRIYATLGHGLLCVPKIQTGVPEVFDLPIRLGRVVFLPDGTWILPPEP